jgi:hypothetical protein
MAREIRKRDAEGLGAFEAMTGWWFAAFAGIMALNVAIILYGAVVVLPDVALQALSNLP